MEIKNKSKKTLHNEVRIIAGKLKSRTISFLSHQGLRPTPDRVREMVFNWISHFWSHNFSDKTVLDLFAGSGAMAIESVSRGVQQAVLIEKDKVVYQHLLKTVASLDLSQQARVLHDSAERFLLSKNSLNVYDLVILDPPFETGLLELCLPIVYTYQNAGALLYIEAPEQIPPPNGYDAYRMSKAGAVYAHLFVRNTVYELSLH